MNAVVEWDRERGNRDDHEYDSYLARLNNRFGQNTNGGKTPLFTTDASGLFDAYLAAFPDEQRQHHNCNACRRFVERFGALVTIDEAGITSPAFWSVEDAPENYRASIGVIERIVRRAKVTGVFLSSEKVWGQPETGMWHHLHILLPKVYSGVLTAYQAMAEKREDFKTVLTALGEYPKALVANALNLLDSDALYRSEKVIGPMRFLHDLHTARDRATNKRNVTWRAIATAPAGFCHPRSSMAGTLLDDIKAGVSFEKAAASFRAKMAPNQYQRPQAAPSAGTIAQAERLFAQMGPETARALERRFMRLEEVQAIWRPTYVSDTPDPAAGIFGHLSVKKAAEKFKTTMTAPTQNMTWVKFRDTVLPKAIEIDVKAPAHGDYVALTTAVHDDAAPIMQWDRPERRNPACWYRLNGGSTAESWSLKRNEWVAVTAICRQPSHWYEEMPNQANGAVLLLRGAVDTADAGNALFPETLKAEFHAVRSVIEAYSRTAILHGREQATACGIGVNKSGCDAALLVRTDLGYTSYKITSWD